MNTTKWLGLLAVVALPLQFGRAQAPPTPTAVEVPPAPTAEEAAPAPPPTGDVSAAAPANLSKESAEVVKLASSGVTEDVVLAYVNNSQAPFDLSANDV